MPPKGEHRYPDRTVVRARIMRERGLLWREISDILDIPIRTIRSWCEYENRTKLFK